MHNLASENTIFLSQLQAVQTVAYASSVGSGSDSWVTEVSQTGKVALIPGVATVIAKPQVAPTSSPQKRVYIQNKPVGSQSSQGRGWSSVWWSPWWQGTGTWNRWYPEPWVLSPHENWSPPKASNTPCRYGSRCWRKHTCWFSHSSPSPPEKMNRSWHTTKVAPQKKWVTKVHQDLGPQDLGIPDGTSL